MYSHLCFQEWGGSKKDRVRKKKSERQNKKEKVRKTDWERQTGKKRHRNIHTDRQMKGVWERDRLQGDNKMC